ncbi:unnamed protein product [Dracunculus medinensis]|uniref:LITAF domain-containing protein n=1 Tax=Dracunculus medinensis TaxID=318479 RepID=A0A0N4UQV9_DRAME|nr:unnamed protein product [Dracunculus medinensis]VDN60929.1 unnamed protein product [Dracunculus medinensis]
MADKNEINLPRGAIKKAYTAKPYYEFCPECRCKVETRQKFITGRLTWIFAIIAFLFFIPLAAVPFFIRPCKDVLHHCPNYAEEWKQKH